MQQMAVMIKVFKMRPEQSGFWSNSVHDTAPVWTVPVKLTEKPK